MNPIYLSQPEITTNLEYMIGIRSYIMQMNKIFFGDFDSLLREAPSHEDKLWAISRDNPYCPLSKFIGNDKAVRKLQAVAYDALGKDNHLCREISFSIFGPASSGKTTLVRLFSKTVGLPFIEFGPQIKNCEEIFKGLERVLAIEGVPLVEFRKKDYFEVPPCVVFIDEIHAVQDGVIQGLLKATEYNDAILITEKGKTINCKNVCWMIATTDEGMLFDAFRSRFSSLWLSYLGNKDIAKIVHLSLPEIPLDACELIAFFNSRVPRKALEFARYARIVKQMQSDDSWESVIKKVAIDEGIDELGMQAIHRRVLEALANSPVANSRMPVVVGRKKEEVSRYVMPWLLAATEESQPYVKVTNKGYELTEYGINQCLARKIVGSQVRKHIVNNTNNDCIVQRLVV